MTSDRSDGEAVLAELRKSMRDKSVYRGRVISLEANRESGVDVKFHRLPTISREAVAPVPRSRAARPAASASSAFPASPR